MRGFVIAPTLLAGLLLMAPGVVATPILDDAIGAVAPFPSPPVSGQERPTTGQGEGEWRLTLDDSWIWFSPKEIIHVDLSSMPLERLAEAACAADAAACDTLRDCLTAAPANHEACEILAGILTSSPTTVCGVICLSQPDQGRIYEGSAWEKVLDTDRNTGSAPRAYLSDDMAGTGATCAGAAGGGFATAGPMGATAAGGGCVIGGLAAMGIKALTGAYEDTRNTYYFGYYRTQWHQFGWEEPLSRSADPATGTVVSKTITETGGPTDFWWNEETIKGRDRERYLAHQKAVALARTHTSMAGTADALVYFAPLGIGNIKVTSSGGQAQVHVGDGEADVELHYKGIAQVAILEVLGLDWSLEFTSTGQLKSVDLREFIHL